jgi:glycosyltransferase involved in cell wall biosynthesis
MSFIEHSQPQQPLPNPQKIDKRPFRNRPINPTVSVIIPTLNEADNLPHVLPNIPSWIDELIIVDGRSSDNTIEVAKALWPTVHIVLEKKPGKGIALRTGMEAAKGDLLVLLDADGSTNPTEIPVFIGALLSGADFVKGSRFLQGGGTADMEWYRRWGNKGLLTLVKMLFGGQYSDLCYGYNALWRDAFPKLALNADGFEIETLLNIRALKEQLVIAEVPSFEAERIFGVSHLNSIRDGFRILHVIGREYVASLGNRRASSTPFQRSVTSQLQLATPTSPFHSGHSGNDHVCPTCDQPITLSRS